MYYITGRYKVFGDALQLYGDVMYSNTKQDNALAPSPFSIALGGYSNPNLFIPNIDPRTGQPFGPLNGTVPGLAPVNGGFGNFSIAAQQSIIQNSPFNPFPGRQGFNPVTGAYTNPLGSLTALSYRTIQELGNRRTFFDHDYYRYVTGVNGDFDFKDNAFISRFGYDSGFVYERFDEQRIYSGDATRGGIYNEIIAGNFDPFIGETAPVAGIAPIY